MGIEAFAEAAGVLLPGWEPVALEDVEFLAPFKFYRDEPRELEVRVALRDGLDGTIAGDCRLIGRRTRPGGEEQETVHFTATVRLVPEPSAAPAAEPPAPPAGEVVGRDAVYAVYFHGPAYQVLEAAWRAGDAVVGRLAGDAAAQPHARRGAGPLRTPPGRALLPDGGRLGARHERAHGPAGRDRSRRGVPGCRRGRRGCTRS